MLLVQGSIQLPAQLNLHAHSGLEKLDMIFSYYCHYAPASSSLDNVKFFKAIKEMGLIDGTKVTRAEVDLIFTRVRMHNASFSFLIDLIFPIALTTPITNPGERKGREKIAVRPIREGN